MSVLWRWLLCHPELQRCCTILQHRRDHWYTGSAAMPTFVSVRSSRQKLGVVCDTSGHGLCQHLHKLCQLSYETRCSDL